MNRYTYWQDGPLFIGSLNSFPDYQTQGESLEELEAHLRDLYKDLKSGEIPFVREERELSLA